MSGEDWGRTVGARKADLVSVFDRLAQVGHGELSAVFNRASNRIEINVLYKTRDGEQVKVLLGD